MCCRNLVPDVRLQLRRHLGALSTATVGLTILLAAFAAPAQDDLDAGALADRPGDISDELAAPIDGAAHALASQPQIHVDVAEEPMTDSSLALFNTYCLLCHGPDGRGVPGLGVSLVDSSFVQSQREADLAEFLKVGRLPNDPASLSGRPMPGFAWMDRVELSALAAHLKTLGRAARRGTEGDPSPAAG